MKELNRPKNLKRFYLAWQRLNHVYEEYAKEHDLTYISMFVLQLIDDGTTQKEICDTLYFPKQTVNKVILSFEKKGYITLVENPDDRRARSIMLTKKGRLFQGQVVSHIEKAELAGTADYDRPLGEIYRHMYIQNQRDLSISEWRKAHEKIRFWAYAPAACKRRFCTAG